MRKPLLLTLLAGLSGQALAHPGHGHHGHDGFSLIHYLTEPAHVAGIVLVVAIIGSLAGWLWRRNKAK